MELYNQLKRVLKYDEIDTHYSNLYCKVTKDSKHIIDNYEFLSNVTTFTNVSGSVWYEVPFAYPTYLKSIKDLRKESREIILKLLDVVFVQLDELTEEEQMELIDDLDRLEVNYDIENDTLLPGVLEEFIETCHIDIDKLVEESDMY